MAEQFIESSNNGALNGATPVELVPAPGASQRHVVRTMTISNLDDAIVTLTVKLEDSAATDSVIWTGDLDPGDTWVWSEDVMVLDATTKTITAVLDGAANSTDPDFVVNYALVEN